MKKLIFGITMLLSTNAFAIGTLPLALTRSESSTKQECTLKLCALEDNGHTMGLRCQEARGRIAIRYSDPQMPYMLVSTDRVSCVCPCGWENKVRKLATEGRLDPWD